MRTFDKTRLAEQHAAIMGMLPITFTFKGHSYNGWKHTGIHTHDHTIYGEEPIYDLSIGFLVSDISPLPDVDEIVTYNGVEYRILNNETDSGDIQMILHCGYKYASK
jgi:hypothetical protein